MKSAMIMAARFRTPRPVPPCMPFLCSFLFLSSFAGCSDARRNFATVLGDAAIDSSPPRDAGPGAGSDGFPLTDAGSTQTSLTHGDVGQSTSEANLDPASNPGANSTLPAASLDAADNVDGGAAHVVGTDTLTGDGSQPGAGSLSAEGPEGGKLTNGAGSAGGNGGSGGSGGSGGNGGTEGADASVIPSKLACAVSLVQGTGSPLVTGTTV
jgi:hypothetical protein